MATPSERSNADVLVLFAFDQTLVNVDSNVHLARELDAELAKTVNWNHGDRPEQMDQFLGRLAKERPQVSHEDIVNAAQRLPFSPHLVDAIRLAVDDFGATAKIVSDASVFAVRSFLQRQGLEETVSEVVANPTHFEDGGKVLRVRPYETGEVSPCQATRNDVVFARAGEANGKQHELLPLTSTYPAKVQAHIRTWETGEDILAYFKNFFHEQYPNCRSPHSSISAFAAKDEFAVPRFIAPDHGKLLVVFDFDDSLVNEDSDSLVFQSFHPELHQTIYERHAKKPIWPNVFDDMLQVLADEKPDVTPEMIRQRVAQIPIQARMIDAIRMVAKLFGADVKVISDGNTFYIGSMLEHRELDEHVREVYANPVEFETLKDGRTRLRIRPYHADHLEPHECSWCPSNMCKGSILDSIRSGQQYSRVIYVGDGTGDFCPAARLTKNDVVLARSHLLNGEPYGLQKRLNANPGIVQAPVVPWSTGYDIYRRFVQFCPTPYALPRSVPRITGSVLVVFDYDWSLINDNSDTYIFQKLYPELLETLRERRKKEPSWTKIMDDMLGVIASEKPNITPDMIRDAIARVPIQPHMLDALRLAAEQFNADVKIVSDANSVYIESMLEHYGLAKHVSEVITNPASFKPLENGHSRLHVRPYHSELHKPHGCAWCPTNMCKGRIVDDLRRKHPYTSVLYVGDGSGDFCAATRLAKTDVVFARADEANGRSYGLQKRIDSNLKLVEASVVPWSSGDDIYRHFAQFFHLSPLSS
ncbi:unnamed protein product [Phytophthora lilii]|uniref:Unnamed protein product n=1 Tax=Phytophthora lilii TaxID=2077276 RepID=A0A9W7D7P7_9STRA|nr:unnamed protein product [Phytophthora lilii]